jgi:hypothetical protein
MVPTPVVLSLTIKLLWLRMSLPAKRNWCGLTWIDSKPTSFGSNKTPTDLSQVNEQPASDRRCISVSHCPCIWVSHCTRLYTGVYAQLCRGTKACIPQPKTEGQTGAIHSGILMVYPTHYTSAASTLHHMLDVQHTLQHCILTQI